MRIKSKIITAWGGLGIAAGVRAWMGTLDYRALYYDPTVDPANPLCRGRAIYLFWHEYISFPLYLRGHNNLSMLLSTHRDAEWLSRAAYHLGFSTVRGSTSRGSSRALRELLEKSKKAHLTITPDGPRGPRRRMAPGPIYLSSKLQIPLVMMGFGYDRPWRMKSWDRFALPKPYSRARSIVSPRVQIPPELGRDEIESYRTRMEILLHRITEEAESWAGDRSCRRGEQPILKVPAGRGIALNASDTRGGLSLLAVNESDKPPTRSDKSSSHRAA